MADNLARMTSEYPNWETPPEVFNYLDQEFNFTLDPAAEPDTAKCDKYYTPEDNGLAQSWKGERVFLNPPYGSEISDWIAKAHREREEAEVIVLLIPSRTDTTYWHDYIMDADEIRLVKGRIKFLKEGEKNQSATFASSIVVFDECTDENPELKQVLDWKNQSL